ncbi:MAG: sulfate ABC transporter permease subunit CysT [Verrucomicrobiota bacterium]|nr:sulfate ABC transporter permease subunit CysT [Verrucomicrobiota bacterium]
MRARHHILPGFQMTLGFTVAYLSLLVLIPLAALFAKTLDQPWSAFWHSVWNPRVIASYRLSFGAAFAASLVNGFFGLIAAWTLTRYRFPGRKILDALVDLPFALPTAVAGIALTALYAPNGWLGKLLTPAGIIVAYTPLGVLVALIFIGFPFVVRTLQPVLADLAADVEEAAAGLGATRWQTFMRVIFPALFPSLLTGIILAFGRAVGEYGSIVFISGNLPFKTEITPLLIVSKLEQYDYNGAASLGFMMLVVSFLILVIGNLLQTWNQRRHGSAA